MKRYVHTIDESNKVELDIVVVLDSAFDVAAATNIKVDRRNMSSEYQLTDVQLQAYNDFITTVVSMIHAYGFDIQDEYQSTISYSYYIQFTPTPYSGFEDEMLELDVKFRISDHYSTSSPATHVNRSRSQAQTIFKSFVVDGVEKDNIAEVLLSIKHICQDLKIGDYSKLM